MRCVWVFIIDFNKKHRRYNMGYQSIDKKCHEMSESLWWARKRSERLEPAGLRDPRRRRTIYEDNLSEAWLYWTSHCHSAPSMHRRLRGPQLAPFMRRLMPSTIFTSRLGIIRRMFCTTMTIIKMDHIDSNRSSSSRIIETICHHINRRIVATVTIATDTLKPGEREPTARTATRNNSSSSRRASATCRQTTKTADSTTAVKASRRILIRRNSKSSRNRKPPKPPIHAPQYHFNQIATQIAKILISIRRLAIRKDRQASSRSRRVKVRAHKTVSWSFSFITNHHQASSCMSCLCTNFRPEKSFFWLSEIFPNPTNFSILL